MNNLNEKPQSLIDLKTLIKIRQPDASLINQQEKTLNSNTSKLNQSSLSSNKDNKKINNTKSPGKFNSKKTQNLSKASFNNFNKTTNQQSVQSNLSENVNYSIFTSKESSGSIVCSNKPIQGRLINSSFLTEKDLYEYSYALIKDANILLFDKVYPETIKLEQIFQEQLKLQVANLFQGQSTCFFLFGAAETGKSYFLRGGETNQEKGQLTKTVNEILNLIEINKQTSDKSKFSNFG